MKPRRLLLAVALFLSALLYLQSPLGEADPFRKTFVFLPLIVASFLEMTRWARRGVQRGGAQRGGRRFGQAQASGLILGLLFLVTIGRSSLGLALTDRLVAAAWVVLLAWQVLRLLPAMRRSLGTSLPDRPPWIFLILPLTVYVAILPWSAAHHPPDGDEPYYLLLTHSLAHDLDSDLANNYAARDSLRLSGRVLEPQPGDPVGPDGELYSRHNMLLPLVLAPAYRVAGVPGALLFMNLLAAFLCWMTMRLGRHYSPERPGETMLAWAILAFTPPLLFYSYQVWVEVPAALLVVLALDGIHRIRETGSERRAWIELGLGIVLLPLLKIRFLLISGPLLLLALRHCGGRCRRYLGALAAGFVALIAGILLFNKIFFGNPLKYHDIDGLATYSNPPIKYLEGLFGLLYDCAFGLFAYAPIWLLLLPAVLLAIRLRDRLPKDFAIVFAPYLLLLFPRGEWFGAWSPPFRYGMAALPLVALLLVPLLVRRHSAGARAMLSGLLAISLALTVLWVVHPGWTYNLAHGRTHLLDQLSTSIGGDVARFFPSSIRPRTATWVWPVASLLLVWLGWKFPRRRWRRTATVWGTAVALLTPAVVVTATSSVPTRIVEFEDPWVRKSGGQLYPDLWVIYRPRFDGGWALPPWSGATVPVVAGGERLSISLRLRNPTERAKPATLVFEAGDRILTSMAMPRNGEWVTIDVGEFAWRPGDDLRLEVRSPAQRPRQTQVILHRARFGWR